MNSFFKSKRFTNLFIFFNTIITSIMLFNINIHAYSEGVPASTKANFLQSLKPFLQEYKLILNIFIAFVIMTNFIIFIYHFCKLGAQACDHPLIRKKAINDLIVSGVCLGLMGGAGAVYVILFTIIMK